MQADLYNGLCLAYIGDAIYEVYARKHILDAGYFKVKDMHHYVTQWTNAGAQADCIHQLLNLNMLTDEEQSIYKKGRNSHIHSPRKNVELATYLDATGFEALLGYLYLEKRQDRLEELIAFSFQVK